MFDTHLLLTDEQNKLFAEFWIFFFLNLLLQQPLNLNEIHWISREFFQKKCRKNAKLSLFKTFWSVRKIWTKKNHFNRSFMLAQKISIISFKLKRFFLEVQKHNWRFIWRTLMFTMRKKCTSWWRTMKAQKPLIKLANRTNSKSMTSIQLRSHALNKTMVLALVRVYSWSLRSNEDWRQMILRILFQFHGAEWSFRANKNSIHLNIIIYVKFHSFQLNIKQEWKKGIQFVFQTVQLNVLLVENGNFEMCELCGLKAAGCFF